MDVNISHKIQLVPNNKQKTYFRKAFGISRLAYNWGLQEWERRYKEGEKRNFIELYNKFNAIKGEEFPFVYEVTKYACSQALRNVDTAFKNFVKGTAKHPTPKTHRDNQGSFYIAEVRLTDTNPNSKAFKSMPHNEKGKHQYLRVPNLGYVKMAERLRFNGKINSVTISQSGDRFFVSFSMQITREEYLRTHPIVREHKQRVIGIDLGLSSIMTLSDGIAVSNPKFGDHHHKRVVRLQRQLSRSVYPRNKKDKVEGVKKSSNYRKKSRQLANLHRRIADVRNDFEHKVTSILSANYSHIVLEDLNVVGMIKNHRISSSVQDAAFYAIREKLEYKKVLNGVEIAMADRFYPSSKTCSACGYVNKDLKLYQRTFRCPECGAVIDRDLNAAINLCKLADGDFTEAAECEVEELVGLFERNGIESRSVV